MPEIAVSTAQPGTRGRGKADLPGFQPGFQLSRRRAVLSGWWQGACQPFLRTTRLGGMLSAQQIGTPSMVGK